MATHGNTLQHAFIFACYPIDKPSAKEKERKREREKEGVREKGGRRY